MDIALTLESLLPACQYGGSVTSNTEEAYNNIRWEDERTKPTWAEIQAEWVNTNEDINWAEIRAQRDALLLACDWSQLMDSPLSTEDKAAWSAYRQALRDIPQDYPTGSGIVWPEAPVY